MAACLLVFAACAGDDDGATPTAPPASLATPNPQPEPPQPLASEQVSPEEGVIEVAATGTLFVQNHLAVPIGESIIIRVTNNDPAPHNLRLAGIDGIFETEDDAVTVPEAIDQGSVGELSFAPIVDGYYTFRCDFHPTTMGGRIVAGEPSGPALTPAPTPSPTPAPTPEGETVTLSPTP
jgi:hypothetical protein